MHMQCMPYVTYIIFDFIKFSILIYYVLFKSMNRMKLLNGKHNWINWNLSANIVEMNEYPFEL